MKTYWRRLVIVLPGLAVACATAEDLRSSGDPSSADAAGGGASGSEGTSAGGAGTGAASTTGGAPSAAGADAGAGASGGAVGVDASVGGGGLGGDSGSAIDAGAGGVTGVDGGDGGIVQPPPACDIGEKVCGGVCVDTRAAAYGCGSTGCTPCAEPANGYATCSGTTCDFECAIGFQLSGNACVNASTSSFCQDGLRNGAETAVDCGGAECPPCAAGLVCRNGEDCQSFSCVAGLCTAPTCSDSIQNALESDVDCGGSCGATCEPGQTCGDDDDCDRGPCELNVCGCTPLTCGDLPGQCGTLGDRCGGTLDCSCGSGELCLGTQQCCAPTDCTDYPGFCGTTSDGCGNVLNCGCGGSDVCFSTQCCTPRTACPSGLDCGTVNDDCGGTYDCGGCAGSLYCAANVCTAPTCDDGLVNGAETDLDCGGSDCAPCRAGRSCTVNGDCESGECTANICRSTGPTLAVGQDHACAVSDGGRVLCWGDAGVGELGYGSTADYRSGTIYVKGLTDAVSVAVSPGGSHSCAVRAGGQVVCWGSNAIGRLGDGTTTNRSEPVAVSGVSGAILVTCGTDFSCALLGTGEVRCWGFGAAGRLGQGGTGSSNTAVAVVAGETGSGNLTGAVWLATGYYHSCAVLDTGRAVCWGTGANGRLGNNATGNATSPVYVHSVGNSGTCDGTDQSGCLDDVAMLAAGENVTLAIHEGAQASAWGADTSGENGASSVGQTTTPVRVSGVDNQGTLDDATWVAMGLNHGCAVRASGQAVCWGEDDQGRLGDDDGSNANESAPVAVAGGGVYTEIAVGAEFTCARHDDGQVGCWGYNNQGQLGDGTTRSSLTPQRLPGALEDFVEVDTGHGTSCAITTSGQLYCWGEGDNGELGRGETVERRVPTAVPTVTNASDVAVGEDSVCVALTTGAVQCWGYNAQGQLGRGNTTQSTTPVAVTGLTDVTAIAAALDGFCALEGDGTVWCWGYLETVGDGTVAIRTAPVQVHGVDNVGMLTNAKAIGGGTYHMCAVHGANDTVACWGLDDGAQLGDDNLLVRKSFPVAVQGGHTGFATGRHVIEGGRYHTCALKANGEAWCWGYGPYGKTGDGDTNAYDFAPVRAGTETDYLRLSAFSENLAGTCAIRATGQTHCWGFNNNGELGDESTTQRNSPVRVHHTEAATLLGNADLTSNAIAVSVGENQAMVVHANGTISAWGYGLNGRLGNGYTDEWHYPVPVSTPVR